MPKSKARLTADFMRNVQQDENTGEVTHTALKEVQDTISAGVYSSGDVDAMFDEIITEIETIATGE